LAWSIDVAADIYLLRWEALARSCGGWFSIAGISAASRPIAPFAELPQDRHAHLKVDQQVMNALRKDKAPIVLASICSPALAVPK
jgi:hypothetical protein